MWAVLIFLMCCSLQVNTIMRSRHNDPSSLVGARRDRHRSLGLFLVFLLLTYSETLIHWMKIERLDSVRNYQLFNGRQHVRHTSVFLRDKCWTANFSINYKNFHINGCNPKILFQVMFLYMHVKMNQQSASVYLMLFFIKLSVCMCTFLYSSGVCGWLKIPLPECDMGMYYTFAGRGAEKNDAVT